MKFYSISPDFAFLPTLVRDIPKLLNPEQHLSGAVFLLPTQGARLDFQKICFEKYGILPKTFVLNETVEDDIPAHFIFCVVFKSLYEALEETPLKSLRSSVQVLISLTKAFIVALNEMAAHQVLVDADVDMGDKNLTKYYFDIFYQIYKKITELQEERQCFFSAEKRIQRINKLKRYLSFLPNHRHIVVAGVMASKPSVKELLDSLKTRDHVHMVLSCGKREGSLEVGHPFYLQQGLLERFECNDITSLQGEGNGIVSLLECATLEREAQQIACLLERFSKEEKKTAFVTQNYLLQTLVQEELLKFNLIPNMKNLMSLLKEPLGRFLYLSATVLFKDSSLQNIFAFLKNTFSGMMNQEVCEAEIALRKQGLPMSILRQDFLMIEEILAYTLHDQRSRPAKFYGEHLKVFLEKYVLEDLKLDDVWNALNHLPLLTPEEFVGVFKELLSKTQAIEIAEKAPSLIYFWTPLEARLRVVDVMILGDLNEDSWPGNSLNPWLSDKIKEILHLPSSLEYQSLSFLDFLQLSKGSAHVILTRSLLKDGKAQTPSRFLYAGSYFKEKVVSENKVVKTLNLSYQAQIQSKSLKIYQSDVRLLIQNPYAFYLKKILGLSQIPEFQEKISARVLGQMVHKMFEMTLESKPFENSRLFDALTLYQKSQFDMLCENFKMLISELQKEGWTLFSEIEKSIQLGPVQVSARMDLVLMRENNVRIVDYKTGLSPSLKSVLEYTEPQLALEALCFQNIDSLEYWHTPLSNAKIKEIRITPESEWMEQAQTFFVNLFQSYTRADYVFEKTETVFERDSQHFMRIEF